MTASFTNAGQATADLSLTDSHARNLLHRALRSTFWLVNSSLFVRALNFARGIILARLLLPDDFGLFGLASVVVGFTQMFSDIGTGMFLLYRQESIEEHADTAFYANAGIATLLAAAVAATAPLVGRLYGRTDLVPVLVVMAFALWLQAVSTIHRNLLRRALRFRVMAGIDAVMNLTTFVAAVGLAVQGFGVWAFVLSTVAGNLVSLVALFWAYPWRPGWHFSRPSLAAMAPFSGWYLGQAIVWYVVLNIDNLLVGKFLGIPALGIYGLAYNYALLPITLIAGSLGTVVFAELARLLPNRTQFWRAYHQFSRLLAAGACPIAFALSVSAQDLLPRVFGPRWNAAIIPFQILALYGVIRGMWIDPLAALGRFDLSFGLAVASAAASLLGILAAVRAGLGTSGVAWVVLIVGAVSQLGALLLATRSWRKWFEGIRMVSPFIAVGACSALAALGLRRLYLSWFGYQGTPIVLLTLLTVFGIYAVVFRSYLRELLGIAQRSEGGQVEELSPGLS